MSPDQVLPVVRVVHAIVPGNPHGFVEINEKDFNPEIHERYVEPGTELKFDFNSLTVSKLHKWLDDAGVVYDAKANKAELVALCEANADA